MNALAKAVKRAAQIREESWDQKAYDAAVSERIGEIPPTSGTEKCYRVSLRDACDQAADDAGFDTWGTTPVYLLLANSWNDALEWAAQFDDDAIN